MAVCVLLQVAVFSRLHISGAGPDIALVAALALAYREGPESGAIAGFGAGLAIDLFLSTPFGLSALAFTIAGYTIGLVQGSMVRMRRSTCSASSSREAPASVASERAAMPLAPKWLLVGAVMT